MAIPAQCARISLIGTSPLGEIFDTSFWVGALIADQAEANAAASTVAGLIASTTLDDAIKAIITADTKYTEVRVYAYPTGGPNATAIGAAPVNLTGTAPTGQSLPLQVSLVATLQTDFAGRSFRGRMYFPAHGALMGTNHLFAPQVAQNLALALGPFLTGVNAVLYPVCIVSQTLSTKTPVTQVKVDNKPDIQRRRANRAVASAVQLASVTGP